MKRFFWLTAALLLAGCSLHQPLQVAEIPVPERYLEQDKGGTAEPLGNWWQSFGDERLDQLMQELLSSNLQLEQGFARLEQAREAAGIVGSARYPQVGLAGEVGRNMQPTFAGDFTGNSRQISLAAAFEVDLWGKLRDRARAADLLAEASHRDLETLYLGLTAQLAELYYLAVEQRSQLQLTDRTITTLNDTVQRVEIRYQSGLVPALDLYQAEQNLAAAQAVRPNFANGLATAEHGLAVLLGRYPDRRSAGTLAELPGIKQAYPVGLPASLLQRRPDVAASYARLQAADAEVAAAVADRLPGINLLGSLGHSHNDFSTGLIEGNFWSLAGSLAAPLIDGGRRKAEVKRRQAVVRERLAGYRQTVLDAYREVEDALIASETSQQRIVLLQKTVTATSASLRLAMQNYLFGVNDYLPVLTAQRADFSARSELLRSRRQQLSNRISLARALGGEWMNGAIERRTLALKQGESHE